MEERIDGKTKELEEGEKNLKENEEKSKEMIKKSEEKIKASIKESEEKRQVWEEIEKQMEINSQKLKNLVMLNVGMPISSSFVTSSNQFHLFY